MPIIHSTSHGYVCVDVICVVLCDVADHFLNHNSQISEYINFFCVWFIKWPMRLANERKRSNHGNQPFAFVFVGQIVGVIVEALIRFVNEISYHLHLGPI